jgi:hypothetical protein
MREIQFHFQVVLCVCVCVRVLFKVQRQALAR